MVCAVSDIHGEYDLFIEFLDKIRLAAICLDNGKEFYSSDNVLHSEKAV